MDNLGILIQAILSLKDTTASKNQIAKDLPKLESQLQSDKNTRVKIIAGLDINKSKSLIQSQLATITNQTNAPTIKVGVDVGQNNAVQGVVSGLKEVQTQAQATAKSVSDVITVLNPNQISDSAVQKFQKALGITGKQAQQTTSIFKQLMSQLHNAWYADDINAYNTALDAVHTQIVQNYESTKTYKQQVQELSSIYRSVLTDGSKVFIDSNLRKELEYNIQNAKQLKSVLDTVYGAGKWSYKTGVPADVLFKNDNEYMSAQAILDVYKQISAVKSEAALNSRPEDYNTQIKGLLNLKTAYIDANGMQKEYIEGLGWYESVSDNVVQDINEEITAVKESTHAYKDKLKAIRETTEYDAWGQRTGRTSVYGDTGFRKTSKYDENDDLTSYTITENYEALAKSMDKAEAKATKLEQRLMSVYESANRGSKPVQDQNHWIELARQAEKAQIAIDKIHQADSRTSASIEATANAEIAKLQDLVRQYQNAEYAAESLRTKDVNTVKNIQTQELDKFINKINGSKVPLDTMTTDVNELRTALANVGDKDSLTKFLNQFDIAKAKFESLKTLYQSIGGYQKQIETAISSLNQLNNSTVFRNNSSNPQVTQTKQELVSLRAEYQQLLTQLQSNPTSQGLETLRTKLTELDNRMKTAVNSAKAFENQLRSDNSADQLVKKVNVLSQQMKAYQATNTKAAKAYKQQFSDMFAILSNPNIDNQAFTTVQKQFQALKQEAIATGKVGKTMFQTIGDAVKKFAGWMSMTYLVSSFARSLRDMVNNVIELDSAMTNLKKVTNETEVTYSKFLKNVSKQAKELHSTMTDLIEQTSEWAKLGYDLNQANQLSKASMIYANVGEVDNEQAVTNIVSAMKAFDIAVDDVMSIPDVYNKLGNEFAVSSKNLGSSMSQAATTMAMAGNDFNQVAAILTGAGEILGDNKLDEIGNGMKTVTLRIQNQAGALKELGEEYEDLISVSKTQQQVYELTGGAVNIMSESDPNTFRSTYDILKDVANVIDDMNDTEASELIQLLFGKNRANVGTAVLKAFQSGQIEKAYEAAVNSAGSAQKEFDAWSESIEAHINTFKASWESLSQTIVDSKSIKSIVDLGTTILNTLDSIIEKFGTIPTLLGGITAVGAFKNVGGTNKTRPFLYSHNLICIENETRFKIRLSNCWDDYAKAL